MCKISAILPVYNVGKYIRQCLESIERQTFGDFEVLCIDDCGTDDSVDIINEFINKDSRFKLIRHDKNKGQAAARNTGFDSANGEYIICIDPDDIVDVTEFEVVNRAFAEHEDVDCIWFNAGVYDERTGEKKVIYTDEYVFNKNGYYEINPDNIYLSADYIWNKAFRTSVIRKYNLKFPEGIALGEDAEFYYKAFTQIKKIYYIHKCLYVYRLRGDSTVDKAKKGTLNLKDTFTVYMNIFNYLKENNILQDYKKALYYLLVLRINNRKMPNQNEKVIRMADEVLSKINFPDDFIEN